MSLPTVSQFFHVHLFIAVARKSFFWILSSWKALSSHRDLSLPPVYEPGFFSCNNFVTLKVHRHQWAKLWRLIAEKNLLSHARRKLTNNPFVEKDHKSMYHCSQLPLFITSCRIMVMKKYFGSNLQLLSIRNALFSLWSLCFSIVLYIASKYQF